MNLPEQAFKQLFPEKEPEHEFSISYTNRFKPYNANVKYTRTRINFNLSKKWRKVSKEIQIGLIQSLLLKIFKQKAHTPNIGLYNSFMRNIHIAIPKTSEDITLTNSFNRINNNYFYGLIEQPNLKWGTHSTSKLGSYEYGSDTISISKIFQDNNPMLLDYIMYHEALHKKHKFYSKNGRSHHHTSAFKKDEKAFPNSQILEKEISQLTRKKRMINTIKGQTRKRRFFNWF